MSKLMQAIAKISKSIDLIKTQEPTFPMLSHEDIKKYGWILRSQPLMNQISSMLANEQNTKVNFFDFMSQAALEVAKDSEEAKGEKIFNRLAIILFYTKFSDLFTRKIDPQLTLHNLALKPNISAQEIVAFVTWAFLNTAIRPQEIIDSGILQNAFGGQGWVEGLDVFPYLLSIEDLSISATNSILELNHLAKHRNCGVPENSTYALNGEQNIRYHRSTSMFSSDDVFFPSARAEAAKEVKFDLDL